MVLPNGSRVSYRYDPFGRRSAKTVDGSTTEFVWQGERLVGEVSGDHHRDYVYEPGTFRPLALVEEALRAIPAGSTTSSIISALPRN